MKCEVGMPLGMLMTIFLLSSSAVCLCMPESLNDTSDTYSNPNRDFNTETKESTTTCRENTICNIKESVEMSEGGAFIGDIRGILSNLKNLESVNTSNSVRNIGSNAFRYCDSVEAVTISNSTKNIGEGAFRCTALESITIPNSVKSIGKLAFYQCRKLKSIIIPDSVETIGDSAFAGCHELESVTLSNSVKTISNNTFFRCYKLKSIIIPNSVKNIGDFAFAECHELESVTLSNSVETIGNNTFEGCCKLKFVTLPNPVKIIKDASNSRPSTTFNIIYKLDGGNTDSPTTYTNKGLELKDATKKDCKFIGWFTDSRFEKQVKSIPANSYGNITLYAKFEPSDTRNDNIKKDVVITDKRDGV